MTGAGGCGADAGTAEVPACVTGGGRGGEPAYGPEVCVEADGCLLEAGKERSSSDAHLDAESNPLSLQSRTAFLRAVAVSASTVESAMLASSLTVQLECDAKGEET